MTALELKRYDLFATGPDYDAFFSDIVETPEGKYVRFADVEAYTQAAIAAKNAQIIDLIEALRKRSNGELCGCGVDNPTDVCLSHYDVIEAVVRNRVQSAIAAAMMGAAEHLYQLMMDNSDEALQAQIDCLLADMTLEGNPNLAAYFRDKLIASIPTDAATTLSQEK